MRYKIIPTTLKRASEFVNKYHRHNKAQWGHKFSIGIEKDGKLVGVATAGRPVTRALDNGRNIEITRVCVRSGHRNANSMLYGRMKRICQLMGYEKIFTYTLKTESGASLRAIGARIVGEVYAHPWNNKSRKRKEHPVYKQEKFRWEL
jgi:hypothetical protein